MTDLDAYLEQAAALQRLQIPESDRAEVLRFLAIAAEMAAIVEAAPLDPDALELAPVFSPSARTP